MVAIVAALTAGLVAYALRVACQAPALFVDSYVYLDIAQQPARFDDLFQAKPLFVPFIYRFLDGDARAITLLQQVLAATAWSVLGASGLFVFTRWRARVAFVLVAIGFLLAPFRVGFASAILSESINDSLLALLAAAVLLLPRFRVPAAIATGVIATAWMLTRDSNPLTALVAVLFAALLWRHALRRNRWAMVLGGYVVVVACVCLWSARVAPSHKLERFATWGPEVMPRGAPSMINVVKERVLRDKAARRYFIEHGLPQAEELAAVDAVPGDPRIMIAERLRPVRTWIRDEGAGVYARWLLSHPFAHGNELVRSSWTILASGDLGGYMPPGWVGRGVSALRLVTTSPLAILGLLVVFVGILARCWSHPLVRIALICVVSGAIGAAAAYFGDAIEIERHCYGSGQQIVLGLFLAAVAWLDRDARR